jgi:ADP-ribosyl-[dinitrogen reductase] hydrolase
MSRADDVTPVGMDVVQPGPETGLIGMTACPSIAFRRGSPGSSWIPDMEADLDAIAYWKATAVVTLLPDFEMKRLGVGRLGEEVVRRGMRWFQFPLVIMQAPDEEFEAQWERDGEEIRQFLRDGQNILLHCHGGLGRTGTVAARLLIEFGERAGLAIDKVRAARYGAIETREQEEYVLGLRPPMDD